MKTQTNKFVLTRLRFSLNHFNDILSLKGQSPLVNILRSISIIVGMRLTPGRIRTIVLLVRRIRHLMATQGPKGTCLTLKASAVLLQQSLGGHRIANPRLISGMAVSRGGSLPRIILAQHRAEIRGGDTKLAKFYLSVLNVYREIEYDSVPGLKSITEPDFGTHAVDEFIYSKIPWFVRLFVFRRFSFEQLMEKLWTLAGSVEPIFRSSPGTFKLVKGDVEEEYSFSTHPVVLLRNLRTLAADPSLRKSFMEVLGFTRNSLVRDLFMMPIKAGLHNELLTKSPSLGKLGVKEEAAGKVRLFAMVDAWTQWALTPLHKLLFEILRGVPEDGTFDQEAPLYKVDGFPGLWSLDLTAATDRLAVKLQVALLTYLFRSATFANAWANLLVGRGYRFSTFKYAAFAGTYKYAVGQPMGALSSWAMLAFTHHFLVQVAAYMAGPEYASATRLYRNYAILGDDLVIGDYEVKRCYLVVIASLGIKCGLHKSLLSPKGLALEFAKRTIWLGVDVSPVPLKELAASTRTLPEFLQFVRKYKLELTQALRAFGFGWRSITWLSKPLGKLSSSIRLIILGLSIPADADSVEKFFSLGSPAVVRYHTEVADLVRSFSVLEVNKLRRQLAKFQLELVKTNPALWSGLSVGVLQRLEKSTLLRLLQNLKDDGKGLTPYAQARMQAYGLINWYSIWGTFFEWIDAMWEPFKRRLYILSDSIIGELPHPIDDPFLYYFRYIRVLSRWNELSMAPLAMERPGETDKLRGLPPIQIRLWRKWSGVFQGTQDLSAVNILPRIGSKANPRRGIGFVMYD